MRYENLLGEKSKNFFGAFICTHMCIMYSSDVHISSSVYSKVHSFENNVSNTEIVLK